MTTTVPERGPSIEELTRPKILYTKLKGEVTDNNDPNKRGRLKIKVENLTDDDGIWAEPCVPFAGDGLAFFAMPPKGTGAWVECLDGRIDRFVYSGFFWKEGELDQGDYKPDRVHFETKSLRVEITDASDEVKVEIKSGGSITIKGGEITLSAQSITQDASGNKVVFDGTAFDVKNAALKVV